MRFYKYLFQDYNLNNNFKSRFVLFLFRSAQLIVRNLFLKILLFPFLVFYRIIIEWFMGIELNWALKIGPLFLFHGQGLIINPNAKIGSNCSLRCNTIIGNKVLDQGIPSKSPIIGDNVDIGANVSIIGPIKIGNNVVIGAGSVVVKDIPDNVIIAGNPAHIIRATI